ncbi:hypothetical protein N7533_012318 [Penicillium manginii]|jgi:hypothetical protein|uniref:uncharacterized protein n=1 Tax=Penicillium manginii TaxID=203109 RepID=UPI002549BB4E|nr:uncharacterized protein N7533_012318 [Penicillium manginii]KAJ5739534.1 hypothetical protein N7533_012318 [Penicillium manginii]
MQLTTLLPVLLSTLSLTNAAPQGAAPVFRSNNLDIGGSPGGVAWRFNVSSPGSENSPAFNTRCEGTSYNATACADPNVVAQLVKLGNPSFNLTVQHHWTKYVDDDRQDFWQSGTTKVNETSTSFRIIPDSFYGVA